MGRRSVHPGKASERLLQKTMLICSHPGSQACRVPKRPQAWGKAQDDPGRATEATAMPQSPPTPWGSRPLCWRQQWGEG